MAELIIKTYKQAAEEWFQRESAKPEHRGMLPSPILLYQWAEELDKGHLDIKMQLLALMASREVDQKVIMALADIVGAEKVAEIVKQFAPTKPQ